MPRSRNRKTFPSVSSDMSPQSRREQVIDKANKLLSTKGFLVAAAYLAQDMGEALLHEILESFEATPISSDTALSIVTGPQSTEAALRSLTDMATVMASLQAGLVDKPDPPTAAFLRLVVGALIERWNEVTRWINFFIDLEYILQSMTVWEKVMIGCIQVLEPIFMGARGNTYMGQIASFPTSIDITIRLLCLKDPSTRRPSRVSGFASACSICSLFASLSLFSEVGKEAMSCRLTTLDSQKMAELLECIVGRIQGALSASKVASTIEAAAIDLVHLVSALSVFPLPTLQQSIGGESVLSEAARAAAAMVDSAIQMEVNDTGVWSNIGESIGILVRLSKPSSGKAYRTIEAVLEAGIMLPLLLSLPHCVDPSLPMGLDEAAQNLLYWLLDSRLFLAAKKGGWCEELFRDPRLKTFQSPPGSNVIKSLRDAYAFALHFCEKAFGTDSGRAVPVRMCCSLYHSSPIQQREDTVGLKVCGRCHSMVYCSRACQREDWKAFHSEECLQAAHARRQLKEAGVSVRYRRDKLSLLVGVVNEFLPGLDVLRRGQGYHGIPYSGPDVGSHILAFDFTGVMLRLANSLTSYVEDTLPRFFKTRNIEPHSQSRILRCAGDVKRSPDALLLVAGTFIDNRTITTVCVKMRYSANAADREEYRVVSTVSNVILRSSLPPRDEAGGKLWAELGRK